MVPPGVVLPSVAIPRRPLRMGSFSSFAFHIFAFAFYVIAFTFSFYAVAFSFSVVLIVSPCSTFVMRITILGSKRSTIWVLAMIFFFSRLLSTIVLFVHI